MLINTILSLLAGFLTVLAPCILPFLPIILGGSVDPHHRNRRRPYIIIASLLVSLFLFALLLRVSTALLGIDPMVWGVISGVIIILLGIVMLYPNIWTTILARTGLESKSQQLLTSANNRNNGTVSAILTGAALGPVFSSCSPTYAWVIATVLPANPVSGLFYLTVYLVGIALSLLGITLLGQSMLKRVKWASDPYGWFQKTIAILFILVGIFIATGLDKKAQAWLVERDIFNLIELEQRLVPNE